MTHSYTNSELRDLQSARPWRVLGGLVDALMSAAARNTGSTTQLLKSAMDGHNLTFVMGSHDQAMQTERALMKQAHKLVGHTLRMEGNEVAPGADISIDKWARAVSVRKLDALYVAGHPDAKIMVDNYAIAVAAEGALRAAESVPRLARTIMYVDHELDLVRSRNTRLRGYLNAETVKRKAAEEELELVRAQVLELQAQVDD